MARPRKADGLNIEWKNEGTYPVKFSRDMFAEGATALADLLKELTGAEKPRVMMVADGNVVMHIQGLGSRIGRYLQANGIELAAPPVVINGGEKIKFDDCPGVKTIMNATLDAKVGANDVMLVLGGGTIFDVAGYAASQVRGGLKIVRIPTTPAAMVDAAFADRASLDFAGVKDSISVPSHPSAVMIDVTFAATVLDGVWRGGLGEIVRHAAVSDSTLMKKFAKAAEKLHERDMAVFEEIVTAAVESRVRKGATEFALWSAGRFEAMSAYKFPHGYSVPISICIDCAYAVEKGILSEDAQETICRALADCGALDGLSHSYHLLNKPENILVGLHAWRLSHGSESIIIPCGIGKAAVEPAPDRDAYRKVLKEFLAVSSETDDQQ